VGLVDPVVERLAEIEHPEQQQQQQRQDEANSTSATPDSSQAGEGQASRTMNPLQAVAIAFRAD
jgi:hypothetical protein